MKEVFSFVYDTANKVLAYFPFPFSPLAKAIIALVLLIGMLYIMVKEWRTWIKIFALAIALGIILTIFLKPT